MSALQKEVTRYIQNIPADKLKALIPLLRALVQDEDFIVETDLTAEEIAIIEQGERDYKNGVAFVPLSSIT